jgi:hypothetical protein
MQATESDLNHSVLLPEEVNEQLEDPPSYVETMSTSCVELGTRGPTPASVCWVPPYSPYLSPPEHFHTSPSDSLEREGVESHGLDPSDSLDREGTESSGLDPSEPPVIMTSLHKEVVLSNDLEISSDVDDLSETSNPDQTSWKV